MRERIDEAEVIRLAALRSRIDYATSMLDVCSDEAAPLWTELMEDAQDALDQIERRQLDKP